MNNPAAPAAAQDSNGNGPTEREVSRVTIPLESAVTTEGSVRIKGETVPYTATAGTLPVYNTAGEPTAAVFYVYYARSDVQDRTNRPLAFVVARLCAVAPDGTVWLSDDLHHTIRQFTPEGRLLLTIGDPDTPATLQSGKPFNRPTHVAVCPRTGDVYVSDGYGNSRVHKYDPKGRHVRSWGEPGTDPGCFNVPHNIATDAAGLVYVADRENHRVQVFDGHGQYLGQFNHLHRPCGLAFDARQGDLFYVGELPTHLAVNAEVPNLGARVSILSLKGDLVARIGGRFPGEEPGEFVAPHGCAVDSRGDLYVAEVSWTAQGGKENPPREIRSLQKFERV